MIARKLTILIPLAFAAMGAGIGAPLAAGPPAIGMIDWLEIDADCAFLPADKAYAYNEEGDWQYVFMTGTSEDHRGYMMIDGAVRDLIPDRAFHREDFEMRRYEVEGETYVVTLFMFPGKAGAENTSYTGAIHVSNGKSADAVAFHGDCGE